MTQIKDQTKSCNVADQNVTYATVHDDAAGANVNTFVTSGQKNVAGNYTIWRSYVLFNTNGIGPVATAKLKLYSNFKTADNAYAVQIQNGQPTYPHDSVVLGDYDYTKYSGNGGSLAIASFNTLQYNDIPLNATGIGWINLSGYTKLCLRSTRDIGSNAPGLNQNEYVDLGAAGTVGQEPILEYTSGSGRGPCFKKPFQLKAFARKVFG